MGLNYFIDWYNGKDLHCLIEDCTTYFIGFRDFIYFRHFRLFTYFYCTNDGLKHGYFGIRHSY